MLVLAVNISDKARNSQM